MSTLPKKKKTAREPKVLAIFCSDLHISAKPPLWRSAEPDWEAAQARPLIAIKKAQEEHGCHVFCCGDIFDKWNAPPEAINMAMKYLPEEMYMIPGQHDLPNHNLGEIEKSAYWTLVQSGFAHHMKSWVRITPSIYVYGFPYSQPLSQPDDDDPNDIQIAMCHQYVWDYNHHYPGAPQTQKITKNKNVFLEWDYVFCGDNHINFHCYLNNESVETTVVNCGSTIRRKADEIHNEPAIWYLIEDCSALTTQRKRLDTSQDKFLDIEVNLEKEIESMSNVQLMEELQKMEVDELDFVQYANRYCEKINLKVAVRNLLLKSMRD